MLEQLKSKITRENYG